MSFQVVHVRINDATTGRPTPVRVRFARPEGYIAPFGRLNKIALSQNTNAGGNLLIDGREYAYIDGTCEIRLPAGAVEIEIDKGLEYKPLKMVWKRPDGQVSLRLAMERQFNLSAMNWWAGDTHVFFLSPQAAALEGAAEGLHVVNVLAAEWHETKNRFISNILEFSGQQSAHASGDCQVAVNTQNRHATRGRLSLLNCHRIVFPLSFNKDEFADWTLGDWCDQCHRKGGLVVWPSFPECLGKHDEELIPGKIDCLEWSPEADFAGEGLTEWYRLLNQGLCLPLVGGSAKTSNARPIGAIRTYAQLPVGEEFTYGRWIEAVRQGRTFATRGPLLLFSVVGADASHCRRFHIECHSIAPFDRLELVHNGEIIADCVAGNGFAASLEIERPMPLDDRSWYAARCWLCGQLMAHTSPVYLSPTSA